MTPKERVLKAIAHEETDFVPYIIPIDAAADEKLVKYYGGPSYRSRIVDHIVLGSPTFFHAIAPYEQPDGTYKDLFGGRWESKNITHLIEPPLKEPSFEGLEWPDLSDDSYYTPLYDLVKAHPDKFTVGGLLMGLFERSWALRGMMNILMDMATEPDFCNALYDKIVEWDLHILKKICDAPLDGVGLTDDLGCQRGLIMGPRYWKRYLKPRMAKLFGYIKSRGKYVFMHNCGDNSEIMSDLIEIGLEIFDPLQPEPMDIFALKRRYGKHITFIGGISTQMTLPRGTPEDVRRETEKCLRELGRGGGYIVAPNKPILGDVPVENAVALIETVLNQPRR